MSTALATKDQNTEVVTFTLPAITDEVREAMQEELEGVTLKFDRIKIPSGGGLAFELPNEDDPEDPLTEKTVSGIILVHHPINAWWAKEYSGEKNPPDCSSMDGRIGIERETGRQIPCVSCPKNQWGSAPPYKDGSTNNGKACKNMRRVYLLREGFMFPFLLTLPPTSLENFNEYLSKRIVQKGHRSFDVLSTVSLKKDKNKGGIEYSKAAWSKPVPLDAETKKVARAYAEQIKPLTMTVAIGADEYNTEEPAGGEEEEIF
ncbi:MAG: hypothetical protein A4E55_00359 [Pelotomaculum sp. PtaU1.Bin035]|nr:MAG: hypothetical protein A4E55_00359 [Pelotomaculum sp. PtaU1.Bin035]